MWALFNIPKCHSIKKKKKNPTVGAAFWAAELVEWQGLKKHVPVIFSHIYLIGGFNPPEKYESQLGWLFPIYAKIKNVPNHQPVICLLIYWFIYLFIPYHSVHEHGLWPHTNFPRRAKKWYMAAGPDPWVVGFLKHYRQLPSGKLT